MDKMYQITINNDKNNNNTGSKFLMWNTSMYVYTYYLSNYHSNELCAEKKNYWVYQSTMS